MDLVPIKKSHITYYNQFSLYYITKSGEALLYKKPEKKLDKEMLNRSQYPQFYIKKEDEYQVVSKLQKVLNMDLAKAIASKGLTKVRKAVSFAVEEALSSPIDASLPALPETIEIVLMGAKKHSGMLEALTSIKDNSSKLVDHTINVLSLTAQYCFFKEYPDEQIKRLCLCALLHDVGMAKLDTELVESVDKLTDKQFLAYKKHTKKGYKELLKFADFDACVAEVARDHHERLDGNGYPNRTKEICFEAQVIGLIDSYEALKYQDKNFRKSLKPFEALQIIKEDVVKEKYSKAVFRDLCSCLIK